MSRNVAVHPRHPAIKYKRVFKIVGILQLIAGIACSALALGTLLRLSRNIAEIGTTVSGVGACILFTITGLLSLSTSRSPSQCNVISGLIFAVLSILSCVAIISNGGMNLVALDNSDEWSYEYEQVDSIPKAMIYTMIATCCINFVSAFVHAVYCCRGMYFQPQYISQIPS